MMIDRYPTTSFTMHNQHHRDHHPSSTIVASAYHRHDHHNHHQQQQHDTQQGSHEDYFADAEPSEQHQQSQFQNDGTDDDSWQWRQAPQPAPAPASIKATGRHPHDLRNPPPPPSPSPPSPLSPLSAHHRGQGRRSQQPAHPGVYHHHYHADAEGSSQSQSQPQPQRDRGGILSSERGPSSTRPERRRGHDDDHPDRRPDGGDGDDDDASSHPSDASSISPSGSERKNGRVDVLARIESVVERVVSNELHRGRSPTLTFPPVGGAPNDAWGMSTGGGGGGYGGGGATMVRRLSNLSQSRSFANVFLVLSFVHRLLSSGRTTTTREVFYFYVTHFRSQRECDGAISDVGWLLGVPRACLGIVASPKGWFCGCIKITRRVSTLSSSANVHTIDGTELPSMQGLPITREWLDYVESSFTSKSHPPFRLSTDATCILVIEKEGVYNRLAEDKFFQRRPCILVTGKGYPDLATRAFVRAVHDSFPHLPIYGVCDCNPFGVHVLQTYYTGGGDRVVNRDEYRVPIQWIGLAPGHVLDELMDDGGLPRDVFQELTALDEKKLDSLRCETCEFVEGSARHREEVERMVELGCKVELEALHWLGMDYMGDWLAELLDDLEEESGAE